MKNFLVYLVFIVFFNLTLKSQENWYCSDFEDLSFIPNEWVVDETNNRIFVGDGSYLWILDYETLEPTVIYDFSQVGINDIYSATPDPDNPNIVYIACGQQGLAVLDLSTNELDGPSSVFGETYYIEFKDNYVLIDAYYNNSYVVHIYDISNDQYIGAIPDADQLYLIDIYNKYLFLADVNGVEIYDLIDPSNPQNVGHYDYEGIMFDMSPVYLNNDVYFFMAGTNGLQVAHFDASLKSFLNNMTVFSGEPIYEIDFESVQEHILGVVTYENSKIVMHFTDDDVFNVNSWDIVGTLANDVYDVDNSDNYIEGVNCEVDFDVMKIAELSTLNVKVTTTAGSKVYKYLKQISLISQNSLPTCNAYTVLNKGQIQIHEKGLISISDLSGKILFKKEVTNGEIIDLQGISQGIYFISFSNGKIYHNGKIIF